MASPHSNRLRGSSDNVSDYKLAFLQRVHCLLQLAYESLTPADYEGAEEDDITGDLCKHMTYLTETAPSERWMARFSVHDQHPANDVTSVKTKQPRKGKRRPKIDIRIVCKHRIPNAHYCIEAKRLYRGDSAGEYANDEGVGAFICGDYAKDDDCGGMMGYVQTGHVNAWLPKIAAKLKAGSKLLVRADGKTWSDAAFANGPHHCLSSAHTRDSGRSIVIYHVLFVFTGTS